MSELHLLAPIQPSNQVSAIRIGVPAQRDRLLEIVDPGRRGTFSVAGEAGTVLWQYSSILAKDRIPES